MKLLVLFLCFAVSLATLHDLLPEEWIMFKMTHGKQYKNSFEELFRMNVYKQNKLKIEEHNKRFNNGEVSYSLKMNQFGDLMTHEFKAMMNRYRFQIKNRNQEAEIFVPKGGNLPDSVDWRDKGAVTPVKDQQQCGSCWAFSATGSLEGQTFLSTNKLVSLSEQQLVDCSGDYGNEGCNGGLMDQAFDYIKANKGLDTESSYPYEAEDDKCRFKPGSVGASVKGFVDIESGDENALKEAVATIGPISVAIDASSFWFQFYFSGIYNQNDCSSTMLDHGVLAVGYGSENGQDYWLVKNSWNTYWGMDGYIKMSRNRNNQCGIATQASYPKV